MSFEYEVFYIEEGNWRNHVSKSMSFCNLIWHSLHQHPDIQTIHVSHITIRHVINVRNLEMERGLSLYNTYMSDNNIPAWCDYKCLSWDELGMVECGPRSWWLSGTSDLVIGNDHPSSKLNRDFNNGLHLKSIFQPNLITPNKVFLEFTIPRAGWI